MHRLLILCCLAALLGADDHWIQFRSGPFEVFTDAGAHAGRAALIHFEEFRHALGQTIGEQDLQTAMPVRVLVFRKGERRPADGRILTGRDRYAILLTADTPPAPALHSELVRLLLASSVARMPAPIEHGLEELFSTVEVTGIRIKLGAPPAHPDKDWARVHLLATSPDYYGKLRVIAYNLRRGVPPDAAYRNAIAKTPAEIEQETERHLAAGHFETVEVSSRPMAERDFEERPVEPAAARLAVADLLLPESRAAYEALLREKISVPESHEGLGLVALQAGNRDEARREFAAAVAAGIKSARCYLEYGRLEPDNAKALSAFEQAARLNPKLAEAHFLMAPRESDPTRRVADLKAAAHLNPREAAYWQALAEEYLAQKDFSGAAKAWTGAEQAATDDAARARFLQARLAIESQRLDHEAAERRRKAEEERLEIARLKTEAQAEVRALEARANGGNTPPQPGDRVVPWWDGPKPSGRAQGALRQVDCLGRQARIIVDGDDGKPIRLLVPDPGQVTILGGGEQTLGCGPQKGRRVVVEYFPKKNVRLTTVGEVATVQFQ